MEVYDIIAKDWEDKRRAPFPALKLFLPKVEPDARVLDAGCGNGRNLAPIARKCGEIYGIDSSFGMLKFARERLLGEGIKNGCVLKGSVTNLPFRDGFFDAIYCSAVLHHLPEGQRQTALREFCRVLRDGGMLFLTVWAQRRFCGMKESNVGWRMANGKVAGRYYYFFASDELSSMVGRAGFRVMEAFSEKGGVEVEEEKSQNLVVFARKGA